MTDSIYKYRYNGELYGELEKVFEKYHMKISLAEAIGILELLKAELLKGE